MAWNAHILASGSRDRLIYQRDVRIAEPFLRKLIGHKQEVCGLRWSFDDQQLASGGNDNKLFIWNAHATSPLTRFNDHTAAVMAIAWSPHQHGPCDVSHCPFARSFAELVSCGVRRFAGVRRGHS